MLGGVPRMKEISNAVQSEKMKGVRVQLPLRGALLAGVGQRALAPDIAAELLPREFAGARAPSRATHRSRVRQLMSTAAQRSAAQTFSKNSDAVVRAVARESLDAALVGRNAALKSAVDSLLSGVDAYFGNESIASGDTPQHTLASLTSDYTLVDVDKYLGTLASALMWRADERKLLKRCSAVLLCDVASARLRGVTTPELLAESVWRSLLPIFGTDAPSAVLCTDRNGNASTQWVLAVCAPGVSRDYAERMYECVRTARSETFIDILRADDAESVLLAPLALDAELHAAPRLFVSNVDGGAERERTAELMERKVAAMKHSRTRLIFKNFLTTTIADVTRSVALAYEPLVALPGGGWQVRFAERGDAAPSDAERLACEVYYSDDAFSLFGVGCQRPQCRALRATPRAELADDRESALEHERAARGCLSNWVLALRLDIAWFARNNVDVNAVRASVESALGSCYHVFVGDANSSEYVPLRIRLYECQLRAAYEAHAGARAGDNDVFAPPSSAELPASRASWAPGDDYVRTTLDRAKWRVLRHTFSGPPAGSRVMCESVRTQIYTDERGIEHVSRPMLVCDSHDLSQLLGLRGIDPARTTSNSVHSMAETFGIEAARATAMAEYERVLTDSGSYVDRAHYAVRADVQTRDGHFQPLSYSGLMRGAHDPWQLTSHQRATKMATLAAVRNRTSAALASPTAAVMSGQPLQNIGTGAVQCLLDADACARSQLGHNMEPSEVLRAVEENEADELCQLLRASENPFSASPLPDEFDYSPVRPTDAYKDAAPYSPTRPGLENLACFSPMHQSDKDSDDGNSVDSSDSSNNAAFDPHGTLVGNRVAQLLAEQRAQARREILGDSLRNESVHPTTENAEAAVRATPAADLKKLASIVAAAGESEYTPLPVSYDPETRYDDTALYDSGDDEPDNCSFLAATHRLI